MRLKGEKMRSKALLIIAAFVLFGTALAATKTSVLAQNNTMQQGAIGNNDLTRCDRNDDPCSNQQTPSGTNDLTGTWLTKTTPPPDGPPAFQGIFTFAGDGSLIATQSGGEFPALGNPQLGLWAKNPGNKRQFTLTYYGQDFDDHFQFTDSYRVRGTVNLNASGASFTGVLDITVYDPDGNEVFSDCCATFEGSRAGLGSPGANAAEFKPTSKGYIYLNRNQGWSRRSNKVQP